MAQLQVPPGCARYTVNLSRPLGLVLEAQGNQIVVAEVQTGGLAEREGTVKAGDILISTSGITYSRESDYGGAKVRMGEARVTLNVANEVCMLSFL
jgi:predicted metalloprotease with PDZ domain